MHTIVCIVSYAIHQVGNILFESNGEHRKLLLCYTWFVLHLDPMHGKNIDCTFQHNCMDRREDWLVAGVSVVLWSGDLGSTYC